MTNSKPGTFAKGDARINRKGRPKSFDALRELARQIAHEEARAKDKATGELLPVIIDGHVATNTEIILRRWAASNDPKLQMAFIEIAYGKTPTETRVDISSGGDIPIRLIDYRARITDAAE